MSLVVSSEDTENVAGAEAFRTVAQASRICVALDLKMAPLDPQAAATLADQVRCHGADKPLPNILLIYVLTDKS